MHGWVELLEACWVREKLQVGFGKPSTVNKKHVGQAAHVGLDRDFDNPVALPCTTTKSWQTETNTQHRMLKH